MVLHAELDALWNMFQHEKLLICLKTCVYGRETEEVNVMDMDY